MERRMPPSRVGRLSALALVAIGALYAVALAVGFATYGSSEPIGDPLLAVMEVLTILSALAMVVVMAALHDDTPSHLRLWSLLAFAFTIGFAGTTCVVHVVELTALRQLGTAGLAWPSAFYAAELTAWDLFLGLALLCAAPTFEGPGRAQRLRRVFAACGVLCLAGLIGPAVGNMRLQLVGVLGYAVVLPITCWILADWWRGER